MNTRTFIISICFALTAPVFSQGLHKEINVEQKIDPVKRDAARITVLPTLQLPAINRPQLAFSNRVVTTRVPNAITTLEPVAYGENIFSSPYRGYVALGLGAPLFNGAFSAGYRILDTDRTRLSAWGQYDGDVYTRKVDGDKSYWRDHTASIGLDLHQTVGNKSSLDAAIDYTYGRNTIPSSWDPFSQSISRANLSALYTSQAKNLQWNAGFRYRHFGFYEVNAPQLLYAVFIPGIDFPSHILIPDRLPDLSRPEFPTIEDAEIHSIITGSPVHQNQFSLTFDGRLAFGDNTSLGLDVDADFLNTNSHQTPLYPFESFSDVADRSGSTTGLISLTPHLDYSTPTVKARIGAQADISINSGRVLHIAPEASIAWTPSQIIGFEAKAHGGSELNSLASLYDITPYLNPSMAYSQSHVPYALDGHITIGPMFGTSIEFFGGYAKADKWLMPTDGYNYIGGAIFDRIDISAWHAGAAIDYKYRKLLSARVSYETAPNDYDNCFYEWRDRARHVIDAELKLRPIEPLQLSLGWQFRAGRRNYMIVDNFSSQDPDLKIYGTTPESLGCISDISVGASYSVSDPLTVFARGENLLNRRYYHIGDRYSQGINIIVGASLKF